MSRTFRKCAARLRALFRRSRLDDDLREEIEDHIRERTRQLVGGGVDPREAAFEARRMFGNATAIREQAREVWAFRWLDAAAQDVKYGARLMRRSPGFTAVTVLALAIGIGATAAVFNVADAVLFRSIPVNAPDELYAYAARVSLGGGEKRYGGVTEDVFAAMSSGADFAALGGFRQAHDVTLEATAKAPRTVDAELVSADYFGVLGVLPLVGRTPSADAHEQPWPAVLSERLWTSLFQQSTAAVGTRITVNGVPAVIVGVVRSFRGMVADRPADLFLPIAATTAIEPGLEGTQIRLFARLRQGWSPDGAADRLEALLIASGPSMLRGGEVRVTLTPAGAGISDTRPLLSAPLRIGLGLVGVLLLVACANAGALLLVRFAARQGEFGIRIAIGAGRTRVMRQLVVEALLVSALAAAAGLLVAHITAPMLLRAMPVDTHPPAFELRFDWRLVAFTCLLSALAALAAACASVLRVARTTPSHVLAAESRTLVRSRLRTTQAFVAAQVACALLLLAAAGAMTRTLVNLGRVHPGFDTDQSLTVDVDASSRALPDAAARNYFAELREHVASAPGVRHASLAQFGLMSGSATTGTVEVRGFTPSGDEDRWVRMFWVSPGFFETTAMPIRWGEGLTPRRVPVGERVAVVNERFAHFYFGQPERAIGSIVNHDIRIVGVVADAHYDTLRDEPERAMFIPFTQAPARSRMSILVRPATTVPQAITAVASAIRAFDPHAKFGITTVADRLASTLTRERFVAALAIVLSALALFLSCAGLYATVAYGVSARRNEIAVRMALGATRPQILRLVLHDPLRTTLIGIAAGVPGAWLLMRALSALLFGVGFDATAMVLYGSVLLLIAAGASLLPARRAAAIDPQACLRCE
jgi:predicted permease